MKNIFKLFAIGAVVTLVAGCSLKSEYGITVTDNKDVELKFVMGMDDELIDAIINLENEDSNDEIVVTDEQRWTFLESVNDYKYEEYSKTRYTDGKYKGFIYTLNLGNIDNLVASEERKVNLDKIGEGIKPFTKDGDVYKLNVFLDYSESTSHEIEDTGVDAKLKVTLPNKAKTNNATSVEGTTYTWDLLQSTDIDLTFTFNKTNYALIAIICGGVVLAAAATCVIIKRKRH